MNAKSSTDMSMRTERPSDPAGDTLDMAQRSLSESDNGRTFTCFPRMPLELRLEIWRLASCVPRTVDVWTATDDFSDCRNIFTFQRTESPKPSIYYTANAVPGILHTSREAREIGLQSYILDLGNHFETSPTLAPHFEVRRILLRLEVVVPPQIYINWKYDIICPRYHYDSSFDMKISQALFLRTDLTRLALPAGYITEDRGRKFEELAIRRSPASGILSIEIYQSQTSYQLEDSTARFELAGIMESFSEYGEFEEFGSEDHALWKARDIVSGVAKKYNLAITATCMLMVKIGGMGRVDRVPFEYVEVGRRTYDPSS